MHCIRSRCGSTIVRQVYPGNARCSCRRRAWILRPCLRIGVRYDARARMRCRGERAVPASVHGEVRASAVARRFGRRSDRRRRSAAADVTFVAAAGSTLTADERTVVERDPKLCANEFRSGQLVGLGVRCGRFRSPWQFRMVSARRPQWRCSFSCASTAGDPASASRLRWPAPTIAVAVSAEFLTAAVLASSATLRGPERSPLHGQGAGMGFRVAADLHLSLDDRDSNFATARLRSS